MSHPQHQPIPLTVTNYKQVMNKLTQPYKVMINQASQNFKKKMFEYKNSNHEKRSLLSQTPIYIPMRSPSNLSSEWSAQYEPAQLDKKDVIKIQAIPQKIKTYDIREWKSQTKRSFKDFENVSNIYDEVFIKKKFKSRNNKNYYDFRLDEKQMLTNIFNQIKSQNNYIKFENVIEFFNKCKLFYLYYNIKPIHLQDILKQSAHSFNNKLSLSEFLNIFFIDRQNITGYAQGQQNTFIKKRCVLSQQNWKQLKTIFNTLDTFGNQTISMQPFMFKIKNNYSNRQLINQPAVQYPEINRTIPLKKIIFVLQNRCKFSQKIRWEQIQDMLTNFKYRDVPTIDTIYNKLIQRGQINKFSNYFMLSPEIIEDIKSIFQKCPKYCEHFVKTKFICGQLLESPAIKKQLKEAIVRVQKQGMNTIYIKLEDQVRMIASYAENYIDLDEFLEYFSIKGPINTTAETNNEESDDSSCEDQNQLRLGKLDKVKSMQKLKSWNPKKEGRFAKQVRHLTVCEQFNLSKKQKETIMERRVRQWEELKYSLDQAQRSKRFKANPIPAQLNPQRYREYVKKLEELKQYKRQQFMIKREQQGKIYQYLRANTLLFDSKLKTKKEEKLKQQYKFVSKSLPWFVTEVYMLQNIKQKKILRKKKIYTENKIKIMRAWKKLPDSLQTYEEDSQIQNQSQESHSQEVISKIKTTEVPNFKQLHRKFQQELASRKRQFSPTIPIQFKFSSKKKDKNIIFESAPISGEISPVQGKKSIEKKKQLQITKTKPQINIQTTIKYQEMVNFNQSKLQQKQLIKQRQILQEKQRKIKQKNFARFMRKTLQQSLHRSTSLQNISKNKTINHKFKWKQLQRQNQEQLCKMYSKVMTRPFLFEINTPNFQQQKTEEIHQLSNYVPMKKKTRLKWKHPQPTTKKHVHQSPLKGIDQDKFQSSSKKIRESPQKYEAHSESQDSAAYLNQSF